MKSITRNASVLVATVSVCLVGVSAANAAIYDVTAYGATPNDTTYDSAAFDAAIAAVPASGGEIYVPAGRYKLGYQINVGARHISFRGDGAQQSILEWFDAADGIVFDQSPCTVSINAPAPTPPNCYRGYTLRVEKLSFRTHADRLGKAITVKYPVRVDGHRDNYNWSVIISEVMMTGADGGAWQKGIYLENVAQAKIDKWGWIGRDNPTSGHGAIEINSCVAVYVTKGEVDGGNFAVRATNGTEGVHISHIETFITNVGAQFINSSATSIDHNHFNVYEKGIEFDNGGAAAITGNMIFGTQGDAGVPWMGIHINNGGDTRITGNWIIPNNTFGAQLVNSIGVKIEGVDGDFNVVANNVFRLVKTAVKVDTASGSCDNSVTANNGRGVLPGGTAFDVPLGGGGCVNQSAQNF